jgi:hypothetical protein
MNSEGEGKYLIDTVEDRPVFKIKNEKSGMWERKVLVECEDCKKDNDEDYSPTNCQLISQLENMRKMKNLFGIEGRVVKKKPQDSYADVLEKITEVKEETPQKLVPLWDWLENLGKNINKSQSSPQ